MTIVDRPNKDALAKAVDIFLDTMRPFFVDCLGHAPGASVKTVLKQSLKGVQADNFARNLRTCTDLESAIEVGYFEPLVKIYWEEIFSTRFRCEKKIIHRLSKIAHARNMASHPPHLHDLEEEYTRGSLCHIAFVLGKIRAWEERQAVVRLRESLGGVAGPTEAELTARSEADERVRGADAARFAAENRAHISEKAARKAQERNKSNEAARIRVEDHAKAAEAAMQKAEKVAKRNDVARQEAEGRALKAEAAQRDAERQVQSHFVAMQNAEQRAQRAESALMQLEKLNSGLKAQLERKRVDSPQFLKGQPADRRSPKYEVWLIGEILSGRISRTELSQLAEDTRTNGLLLYYVQAASSDMSSAAWKNYVVRRQEALLRKSSFAARQTGTRHYHGLQVVAQ